jgi:biotin carboxyl carrier protein
MEHTIKADTDGVVERIECEEGGLVDGGVELVSLSKKEEE